MNSNEIIYKTCNKCKHVLPLSNFHKNIKAADGKRSICINCVKHFYRHDICIDCNKTKRIVARGRCATCNLKWLKYNNPTQYSKVIKSKIPSPKTAYKKNTLCPLYLGVHVAERVLYKTFKNVEIMPPNNPGYDFICNHGKKIDVKSSCTRPTKLWDFHIYKNHVADYFLCIAFGDRESLTPLHLWLIPGEKINHLTSFKISQSTINKWNDYKLDISTVAKCCDMLKYNSKSHSK